MHTHTQNVCGELMVWSEHTNGDVRYTYTEADINGAQSHRQDISCNHPKQKPSYTHEAAETSTLHLST